MVFGQRKVARKLRSNRKRVRKAIGRGATRTASAIRSNRARIRTL